jgi:hypothetical protein
MCRLAEINMTQQSTEPTAPTKIDRWENENRIKERELALMERELQLKESENEIKRAEHTASRWRNPLVISIFAATIAAMGNAIITFTNGKQQLDLENLKSEQARILEMIKTGDADTAAENLTFLLSAGLIADPKTFAKLSSFLKDRKPGTGPTLPSASQGILNSRNVEQQEDMQYTRSHPYSGLWKTSCDQDFGLAIAAAGAEEYSISFCGPGGCFEKGEYRPNSKLVGDPMYKIDSLTQIQVEGQDGFTKYVLCPPLQ